MNFVLLSDFHLVSTNPSSRLDELTTTQFKKLLFVLSYARKYNCTILQSGDFFDAPRSWHLLPKVASYLYAFKDLPIYSIFGQHDTYLYSELTRNSTNLGILNKAGLIGILSRKPTTVSNCNIYGCSFGTKVPIPVPTENKRNVLVVHDHISDKPLFDHHKFKKAKRYLLKHKWFDLILAGDIHRKFKIILNDRMIVNTGPILRTKNTEYNRIHKPGFYVWNSETTALKWIQLPHDTTEEVFLNKTTNTSEFEQEKMMESIKAIKKADKYQAGSQLNQVLLSLFDEFNVEEEVRDELSELLG
jgi:DNA repair exonuclease SbcCD nuclease subunit